MSIRLSEKGIKIKNIASEKYFYDLSSTMLAKEIQNKVDIQCNEKSFSKIETDFHQSLKQIIAKPRLL